MTWPTDDLAFAGPNGTSHARQIASLFVILGGFLFVALLLFLLFPQSTLEVCIPSRHRLSTTSLPVADAYRMAADRVREAGRHLLLLQKVRVPGARGLPCLRRHHARPLRRALGRPLSGRSPHATRIHHFTTRRLCPSCSPPGPLSADPDPRRLIRFLGACPARV